MSRISMWIIFMCLAALPPPSSSVSEVARGISHIPTAASLAHCPTSCGGIHIRYPFGIGPGCFRKGFELTCEDITHPSSRLFLGNGNIQINVMTNPSTVETRPIIFNITKKLGVDTYNMSWEAPVKGVVIDEKWNSLYVVGCGVEIHLLNNDTGDLMGSCMTVCVDDKGTMEEVNADGFCHGFGCCQITMPYAMGAFKLKLVLRDNTTTQSNEALSRVKVFVAAAYKFLMNDLYSISVNSISVHASVFHTAITDQPRCERAKMMENYACDANSFCENLKSAHGYTCACNGLTRGNPYILDGCIDYNPKTKDNCTRLCGNLTIPFPFGVEKGCSANLDFQLICTTSNVTILDRGYAQFRVTNVSLDEGSLLVTNMLDDKNSNNNVVMLNTKDGDTRDTPTDALLDSSQEDEIKIKWGVANLTCQQARLQNATYACLSNHTDCLYAMDGRRRLGYRCKCSNGFEGNPYVQHGCTDIDECSLPNYCQGTCQNYEGGFNCTSCSHGKAYDRTKGKCVTISKQHNLALGVTIGAAGALGSLILVIGAIVLANKWKKVVQRRIQISYFEKNQGLLLKHLTSEDGFINMPKIFSLKELEEATNNFDATRILGCGGHGMVYKGILSDLSVVAIKKSILVKQTEIDEFINEVAILSRIIHRNVVKLVGCCLEADVPLLVCEFMSNGTLHDLLHKDFTGKYFLSWNDRIRIAVEAAGALAYLHSTASIQIFHRDVKSENILLDDSFTAKVSDFGISRYLLLDETHVATKIKGTFGYLDPEYFRTCQLTKKSDVYSMGVILVELITRKKPILVHDSGTFEGLSGYFVEQLGDGALMEILDPQIVEEADQEDIEDTASLAEACLRAEGRDRPTMKDVQMRLQFLRTKLLRKIHHFTNQDVTVCYSLEHELASSITLPR